MGSFRADQAHALSVEAQDCPDYFLPCLRDKADPVSDSKILHVMVSPDVSQEPNALDDLVIQFNEL